MLRKRTILWAAILLLLLIAAVLALSKVLKPHQSAAGEAAVYSISADSLYQQYRADERSADRKYLNKVIEVTGKLGDIQHSGTSEIWILSSRTGGGGINCQLFAGTRIDHEPKNGEAVTVKGRCTGFLMDVNLADCVLRK